VALVLKTQSSTPSIRLRANSKRNELVRFLPPLVLNLRRVILSQMVCQAPPHHCQLVR
jgi:hypothetical protein